MAGGQNQDVGGVRLGVDMGVGMIVISAAGPGCGSRTLEFPGISREFPAGPGAVPVHAIPALVEYRDGNAVRLGDGVARVGAADDPCTGRWLRRYLCNGSPVQIPAGNGRMVRYEEAAADLLVPLLTSALRQYPGAGLVFTLPPEAPPVYREFLQRVARAAGSATTSMVGEYQAALTGYGYTPASGEIFLVISFTEAGLEVTALSADDRTAGPGGDGLRALVHVTGTVSCREVDSGIVRDLLSKFRLFESDPRAALLIPQLRAEAARLREHLAFRSNREVRLEDTGSGKSFTTIYMAADLERVLADNDVIPAMQDCIGRALSALRAHGGDGACVRAVVLLGPGCTLPAVQDAVRSRFPESLVCADHPLDAIARGAAGYASPAGVQDRVARSYALRYWDPAVQEHHYRFLVHAGTRYPSAGQVARVVISAVYDGQALLGIPLYEIGGTSAAPGPQIELVSETGGGVRLAGPAQDAENPGQAVHANERSPTLLVATPPARKGEPRFECTFTIDAERNLCLSARDLVTGALVKVNTPVHRLT